MLAVDCCVLVVLCASFVVCSWIMSGVRFLICCVFMYCCSHVFVCLCSCVCVLCVHVFFVIIVICCSVYRLFSMAQERGKEPSISSHSAACAGP